MINHNFHKQLSSNLAGIFAKCKKKKSIFLDKIYIHASKYELISIKIFTAKF
jgi:hypothetical protein